MSKYLEIMNYQGKKVKTKINLDKLDEIFMIIISICSGDEMAKVFYKNGTIETYDSSDDRVMDFDDGEYVLFSPTENHIKEFKNRTTTYDDFGKYS